MKNSTFSKGDLVIWYEVYDECLTKDSGTGIVVNVHKHNFRPEALYIYEVYRSKHEDKMMFEEYCVKKYNGDI